VVFLSFYLSFTSFLLSFFGDETVREGEGQEREGIKTVTGE
jgi:hypothetical protein